MQRTERIHIIERMLRSRRSVSFSELMERLEVSRATLYRDLAVAQERLGLPLLKDEETRQEAVPSCHKDRLRALRLADGGWCRGADTGDRRHGSQRRRKWHLRFRTGQKALERLCRHSRHGPAPGSGGLALPHLHCCKEACKRGSA